MQLISAILCPYRVHDVCDALERFGFRGLTVSEVSGVADGSAPTEIYRGTTFSAVYQPYARIGTGSPHCWARSTA